MNELTWQEKFQAIKSLSPLDTWLSTTNTNLWFVHHGGVERKEGVCLASGNSFAPTPEEAIERAFGWLTCPGYYIVINAFKENRRAVRWNGFMWEDVQEESS